jgi:hypothetical protein
MLVSLASQTGLPGMSVYHHLRCVSLDHSHGKLHVRIFDGYRKDLAIFGLLMATLVLVLTGSILTTPFRRTGWSMDLFYLLPFPVLLAMAYYIVLRISIWMAYGREEIVVDGGQLCWTCTALWLTDELKAAAAEIVEVKAITPWHGNCRIELTTKVHSYRVGDSIRRDDAIHVAHELKRALGLR